MIMNYVRIFGLLRYKDIMENIGLGYILRGCSKYQLSESNQSITKNWLIIQRGIIKQQRYSEILVLRTLELWNGYNRLG